MTVGTPPFTDMTIQAVFDNISKGLIDWPEVGNEPDQISPECKDFIQKLLNPNPSERMGTKGLDEIKNHPFLDGVNWTNLSQNEYFFIPETMENIE